MRFVFLVLCGIAGGILGGMGMGGGTALIPLLVLLLGVEQKVAQATNVIAFVPMAIVTLVIHFKNRLVDKKGINVITFPALIFSVFGFLIAKNLKTKILIKCFGGFLTIIAILQFVCIIKKRRKIICATSIKILNNKNLGKSIKNKMYKGKMSEKKCRKCKKNKKT